MIGVERVGNVLIGLWQIELVVVESRVQLQVQLEEGRSAVCLAWKHAVSRGVPVVEGSHQEDFRSGFFHCVMEVDHYSRRKGRGVPFLWMCVV